MDEQDPRAVERERAMLDYDAASSRLIRAIRGMGGDVDELTQQWRKARGRVLASMQRDEDTDCD